MIHLQVSEDAHELIIALMRTGRRPAVLSGGLCQYTYDFDGVSEVLDHVLVRCGLPFSYQPVHLNAEFASQVSDHDPQVVDVTP